LQQLPRGGTAIIWRQTVLALYCYRLSCDIRAALSEVVGMSMKDVTLDAEIADLVSAAFDRSWQFIKADPKLAHVDMDQKRAQLSRHLTHLAQSGERDLWRLVNRAIGGLRREQNTAEWN
jgi:hypothetical protein